MKIALLVPDNRDEFRRYADPEPYSGRRRRRFCKVWRTVLNVRFISFVASTNPFAPRFRLPPTSSFIPSLCLIGVGCGEVMRAARAP